MVLMKNALTRPAWRGRTNVDLMTITAIEQAERLAGFQFEVTQGSYQGGAGDSKSAGTHDGGGVDDIMTRHLSRRNRIKLIRGSKRAGFASWYRHGRGWVGNEHGHLVLRGHRNLHPEAAAQVVSYDSHRDGLFWNLWDRTWRPKVRRRWSHRKNRPVLGK